MHRMPHVIVRRILESVPHDSSRGYSVGSVIQLRGLSPDSAGPVGESLYRTAGSLLFWDDKIGIFFRLLDWPNCYFVWFQAEIPILRFITLHEPSLFVKAVSVWSLVSSCTAPPLA